MNLKFHTILLISVIFLLGSINVQAKNEDAGAIIGAIIGGVIGNEVGNNDNKDLTTGLGIILGAVIGAEVGRDLDKADRRAIADAQRRAFQRPYGENVYWDGSHYGSRTRSRGHFKTTREGRSRRDQLICREYENTIITPRKTIIKRGIACAQRNGNWYEARHEDVMFDFNPGYNNGHVTPIQNDYDYYSSLRGYCNDYNHENFYAAKDFAQDSSIGLGLYSSQANDWAIEYNRTHRCNTIHEYKRRFKALYLFATDSSEGLGMYFREARQYALENVENLTINTIESKATLFKVVYTFASDSTSGLGLYFRDARTLASSWINSHCEDIHHVERLKNIYDNELEFASSSRGLGLYFRDARKHALEKIKPLTRCHYLLKTN